MASVLGAFAPCKVLFYGLHPNRLAEVSPAPEATLPFSNPMLQARSRRHRDHIAGGQRWGSNPSCLAPESGRLIPTAHTLVKRRVCVLKD